MSLKQSLRRVSQDQTLNDSQILNLVSAINVHQESLVRKRKTLKKARKTRPTHVEDIFALTGEVIKVRKESTRSNGERQKCERCVENLKRIHQAELENKEKRFEAMLTYIADNYRKPLGVDFAISGYFVSMFKLRGMP